ncbi:hypothetical protein ACLQ2R_02735 [Streptosporangium sp. DT93]
MIDADDLTYEMAFSRADRVIDEFCTKLGGRPTWSEEPQWPL